MAEELRKILGDLAPRRWAEPECQEQDVEAGAMTSGTLKLCMALATALRQCATAEEAMSDLASLQGAFAAPQAPQAPLQGLAKRLEEVISVESRCILSRGRVAKDKALIMVAELLSSLQHLHGLVGHPEKENVGQSLLPNMLECILVGLTKCWQGDWHGHLRPELQPMHDLVLRRPLLEKAAFSLLRLVWQRAPSLLDGDVGVAVMLSPQCAYALASLSQEIHDELVATKELAENQEADLELMTQLRRMVLEFLGQAGLRRRHRRKAPAVPPPEALEGGQLVATPEPRKRDLDEESSPGPSHKVQRTAVSTARTETAVVEAAGVCETEFPEPCKKLEEVDKIKVDNLLELLLKDYGASSLATSLADRAEKCMDSLEWAASKSISPEAAEAKEPLEAQKTLEDFLQYLRMLLKHSEEAVAWQMPRFVKRLCDSGRWEPHWRFKLSKVLDLVVHPSMAPHSATALWAQVLGDKATSQCPQRSRAMGSLAKELEIVLTFADQDHTKLQDSMHHLVKSANNCLNRQGECPVDKDEAKPSGSRNPRCESESEDIGSQDTLSDINGESDADFSDFEDARPEMNTLGLLKSDGRKFCNGPKGPGPSGAEQLQRHTSNLKGDWKDRLQKLFDLLPDEDAGAAATPAVPLADAKLAEKVEEAASPVNEEDLPKGSAWRSDVQLVPAS